MDSESLKAGGLAGAMITAVLVLWRLFSRYNQSRCSSDGGSLAIDLRAVAPAAPGDTASRQPSPVLGPQAAPPPPPLLVAPGPNSTAA